MFFCLVLTPMSTIPVHEVPAIRANTTKSTYTFTSVEILSLILRLLGNFHSFLSSADYFNN